MKEKDLREHLVIAMYGGMQASGTFSGWSAKSIVKACYDGADAFLEERKKFLTLNKKK